jgi:hypothetical protein
MLRLQGCNKGLGNLDSDPSLTTTIASDKPICRRPPSRNLDDSVSFEEIVYKVMQSNTLACDRGFLDFRGLEFTDFVTKSK